MMVITMSRAFDEKGQTVEELVLCFVTTACREQSPTKHWPVYAVVSRRRDFASCVFRLLHLCISLIQLVHAPPFLPRTCKIHWTSDLVRYLLDLMVAERIILVLRGTALY